jgi:Pao retrotransposon peptidase
MRLIIIRPVDGWIGYDLKKEYERVGFCDASELAYSAVLYMEINKKKTLIFSKCRIAPIKSQSIHRLELASMVILAEI